MDIKISGLTPQVLEEALTQANNGRLAILERMLETISDRGRSKGAYAADYHGPDRPREDWRG